jgi:hypothetical protein
MYEKDGEMDNVSGRLCRKVDDAYEAFVREHYGLEKRLDEIYETDDGSVIHEYTGDKHDGFMLVAGNPKNPEIRVVTQGLGTETVVFAKIHESWCKIGVGTLEHIHEFIGEHNRRWTNIVLRRLK